LVDKQFRHADKLTDPLEEEIRRFRNQSQEACTTENTFEKIKELRQLCNLENHVNVLKVMEGGANGLVDYQSLHHCLEEIKGRMAKEFGDKFNSLKSGDNEFISSFDRKTVESFGLGLGERGGKMVESRIHSSRQQGGMKSSLIAEKANRDTGDKERNQSQGNMGPASKGRARDRVVGFADDKLTWLRNELYN